jgi:hypothetical protein
MFQLFYAYFVVPCIELLTVLCFFYVIDSSVRVNGFGIQTPALGMMTSPLLDTIGFHFSRAQGFWDTITSVGHDDITST